jgi:hypothetical protein
LTRRKESDFCRVAAVRNGVWRLPIQGARGLRDHPFAGPKSLTTIIREADLIESVADALQYISYFHPMDYIRALGEAYEAEQSPAAKDAIAQILTNSRMCAEGHRPICQDTGIVTVFVKWGQDCRLESAKSLQEVIDEGVRRAYLHPENKLRAGKPHFDPAPSVGAHRHIGHRLAAEILRIEMLGAILVDHGKLRELDVHESAPSY